MNMNRPAGRGAAWHRPRRISTILIATIGPVVVLLLAEAIGTHSVAAAPSPGWGVVDSRAFGLPPDHSGYTTVIASGPSDAWAFGIPDLATNTSIQAPVAVHWTGTAWQVGALPAEVTSEITAASAVSASNIWAVTQYGGYVLHWNGSAWSVEKQLPGYTFDTSLVPGVTALSSTDVWVFGRSGNTGGPGTWHYDGSTWTQQTGIANGIVSASAVSASNIWAIDSDGSAPQDEIVQYDGTAWQPVTASALTGLEFGSILALSATNVWATAGGVLVHFDGTAWSTVTPPWTVATGADLTSDGQGGIWLTVQDSSGNWAAQMTASGTWSRTLIASSGGIDVLALIPGTTDLWGAGDVDTTTAAEATIWAYGMPPAGAVAVGVEGSDGQLWVEAPQLGSGWQPFGGVITGPPAVAAAPSPNSFTLEDPLFVGTGTDRRLWVRSLTDGWQPVGAALCIGGPAAVVTGTTAPYTVTVACRGTDNALWYNSASWTGTGLPVFPAAGWTSLGGVLSAGPAAAPVGTTMTFFVRGTSGAIFTRTAAADYAATPWACIGSPAAAHDTASGVTTFACQGTDRALWEATNAGSAWGQALSLGGTLIGGPAVGPEIDLFAEGTDHAVWERTPAGWTSLGGSIVGGVGAVALN